VPRLPHAELLQSFPLYAIESIAREDLRFQHIGRGLSQWDDTELARQLIAEEIMEDISAATVHRTLTRLL
jgi:hypothetical protein